MTPTRRTALRYIGTTISAVGIAGCLDGNTDVDGDLDSGTGVQTTTFTHRADRRDSISTSPTPTTSGQRYRLLQGGAFWQDVPVTFVVGRSTIPDALDAGAATDAINASFSTWNSVSNTETVFAAPNYNEGLTETTGNNGTNEVVWSSLGDNVIGEMHLWWRDEGDRLLEANVELNADVPWTTNPDERAGFDVQNVLTHELGHCGLRDVTDYPDQTMYYLTARNETKKRTLEVGDKAGWRQLYGSSNT